MFWCVGVESFEDKTTAIKEKEPSSHNKRREEPRAVNQQFPHRCIVVWFCGVGGGDVVRFVGDAHASAGRHRNIFRFWIWIRCLPPTWEASAGERNVSTIR